MKLSCGRDQTHLDQMYLDSIALARARGRRMPVQGDPLGRWRGGLTVVSGTFRQIPVMIFLKPRWSGGVLREDRLWPGLGSLVGRREVV